jgi:FlaA1/EpsC-like NDP-sugar epimerase
MEPALAAELAAVVAAVAACAGSYRYGRRSAAAPPAAPVYVARPTLDAIAPERLLGRPVALADTREARRWIEDADVMVTGAGGSIGSELCLQIAAFAPRRLVLVGHGENSLFEVHGRLVRAGVPAHKLSIVLADVADAARVRAMFARERPRVVFHAAAHKHVPICEGNVCEAVRNNVLGTRTLAMAAAAARVAKFVMISTDKAVNPTSVMGATKRIAETICQSFDTHSSTEFVSVRFGNVLGSRGSVLPVFARQIEAGGPVTITHREMTRYFMTIPEAVSLVLVAASTAHDGSVCVLDMGEPIAIADIAERLIRAMGYLPVRDIAIVETGLRPGEKLYEELLTPEEGLTATAVDRVKVALQQRADYGHFDARLEQLISAARHDDAESVLDGIAGLVPSYRRDRLVVPVEPAAAAASVLAIA